jgi:ribosome biogenesis GTPase A
METPEMVADEWVKVEQVKAAKEAARQARLAAAVPQRQQQQNVAYRQENSDSKE